MTTWKEAFTLLRAERDEAIKLKEVRDDLMWVMKKPCTANTGPTHKLYKEILLYLHCRKIKNKAQAK